MTTPKALFALTLSLALAPLAACGDDDDSDLRAAGGNGGRSGAAGNGSAGRAGSGGPGGAGGSPNGSAGAGQAGASGQGGGGGTGGAPLPGTPTLTREVWAKGLQNPWDIAFLPDGQSALVTERAGKISIVDAEGQATTLLDKPANLIAVDEGGLLGLTIDPEFASNRFVYACFSHRADGAAPDNRVARWRLENNASLTERTDIVTGIPYISGRHSGCRLLFGPDGFLYVGTGDAASGTAPQDPQSLGGKVLRVTRDGQPAPGNPSTNPDKDARIFTYGHRNIQGLALQPGTGRIYSGEHGSNIEDEINFLRPGMNGGWNPVPLGDGDDEDSFYNESNGPGTEGQNTPVPMTDLSLPNAVAAVWNSGGQTFGLSGIAFLNHPSWRDWTGALVGAELAGRSLLVLKLDDAGTSTTELDKLFRDEDVRLRTPVLGPNGALYVTTDKKPGGDEIWRVVAK